MTEDLAGLDSLRTLLDIVSNKDALDAAVKRLVKARDDAVAAEKAAAKRIADAEAKTEAADKLLADAEAKMAKANLAMQEQGREKSLVVTMRASAEREQREEWQRIFDREAKLKEREGKLARAETELQRREAALTAESVRKVA